MKSKTKKKYIEYGLASQIENRKMGQCVKTVNIENMAVLSSNWTLNNTKIIIIENIPNISGTTLIKILFNPNKLSIPHIK